MHKSGLGLALILPALLPAAQLPGAGLSSIPIERVRCDLIGQPFERFSGETRSSDFFIRLPEHIAIRTGSELDLVLRLAPQLVSDVSGVGVSINGRRLASLAAEGRDSAAGERAVSIHLPVPAEILGAGWNRLSLELLPGNSKTLDREARRAASWAIWRMDSRLTVAYERVPLFPELLRFPESFAEEKLLHPGAEGQTAGPTVAILLPAARRDIHFRTLAILGARFGQLGYMGDRDCRLATLAEWKRETENRNAIIVGRWDELGDLPGTAGLTAKLAPLRPGQGLLAEFIVEKNRGRRRWLVVSGGDDAGLEKAALTLGNALALASLPPNPAVIEAEPVISLATEATARPSPQYLALKNSGWHLRHLRGFHNEESFSGWRLPPGFELSSGLLNLVLSHSTSLTNSALQVLVNGGVVGVVPLISDNAAPTETKLALPRGLPGRDPMILTFRASLDASASGRDGDEKTWVTVSGDSSLETTTQPARISGLNQIDRALLRDAFLRKTAFLVPVNASSDEIQMLFELAMDLGRHLTSSRLLWPEACGYSADAIPPPARLRDRSILLLGSASQWRNALPPGTRLGIEQPAGETGVIRMQGHDNRIATLEPSLMFVQMLASPWSRGEVLLVAGGWRDFTSPTLKNMLLRGASSGKLYGDLGAMDARGRATAYDSRRVLRESFVEQIQRRIPAGLSVGETDRQFQEQQVRTQRSARINDLILYLCGSVMAIFVAARLFLLWDRERSRKRSIRQEKPVASTP